MHTDRAIVLARGLGTRMRADDPAATLDHAQRRAAEAGMKAMMPIGGRPFLDYVLSSLADAGIRRVALVVAPDHDAIRSYYDAARPTRLSLDFVVQPEPRGTADALIAAETWTEGHPFLALNSDNLYPVPVLKELASLTEPGLPGFGRDELVRSSNIAQDRVKSFALIEVDSHGYLARIVEKPSAEVAAQFGSGALVSMNVWRFDDRIFAACRDVPVSARGETELPMAVGLAVDRGIRFKVIAAHGPVLDLSRRTDALEVTNRLAESIPHL
jgi:dTDP-glucose pyrophosphorylase